MQGEKKSKQLPANVIRHDVFNIVYVLSLFLIDLLFMTTGYGFWWLWYLTMAYFILDGLWVSLMRVGM